MHREGEIQVDPMQLEEVSVVEEKRAPKYRLFIGLGRHSEKNPSGELNQEGIGHAQEVGESLEGATIVKGYASDHKSRRAIETADLISHASGSTQGLGEKDYPYRTSSESEIGYDVGDLRPFLEDLKIDLERTVAIASGLPPDTNLATLPPEEQKRVAPIRQSFQPEFFMRGLANPDIVDRMSMGLAHQIMKEIEIFKRYLKLLEKKEKSLEGDVYLNNISHGMFIESLLLRAGSIKDGDQYRPFELEDIEGIGGVINPAELAFLDIEDPQNLPPEIPIIFKEDNRPQRGMIVINTDRLIALDNQYEEWQRSLEQAKKGQTE